MYRVKHHNKLPDNNRTCQPGPGRSEMAACQAGTVFAAVVLPLSLSVSVWSDNSVIWREEAWLQGRGGEGLRMESSLRIVSGDVTPSNKNLHNR